ncbi:hypothetical protein PybrP1_003985 [[Pythium] brassicae (nom. inval.)]|nr:hypothetical protein PybrP1_003985 [[Pythium] brassicae (nom. inval.)]
MCRFASPSSDKFHVSNALSRGAAWTRPGGSKMEALTETQRALFAAGGCLDDYEVLKPIGKGKFAVVHKARRRRDGQLVALKQIAAFGAADARTRDKTLKELRLVQAVRHPNIVQYLDAFAEGLNLYGLFEKINKGDYEPIPPVYSDHLRRLAARMISLAAADRPSMDEVWGLCQARPSSATLADKTARIHAQVVRSAARQTPVQDNELAAATSVTAATVGVLSPTTTTTSTAGNAPVVVRRRKATRQRDAPSPEDASSPTSSRPPSSQQQHPRGDETSSSASRPPSSQRSASDASEAARDGASAEDASQKHAEARMELLFERLTLLQYDAILQKRISRKHFLAAEWAPAAWALPSQVSAHSRFADMRALATWLLRLLGVDVAPALPPERPPLAVAQILLLGAERAGIAASIAQLSAPALTSGAGESVCVLLDALCEQVLRTQPQRRCRPPVYPTESVDEMAAQDDLEVAGDDVIHHSVRGRDGADWGDSTASVPGGCADDDADDDRDDDMFAHWLVAREDDARLAGTIPARVDPDAWQRELATMAPKLRDLVAERAAARPRDASWHARIEMLQRNVGLIVSAAPGARRELLRTQEIRQGDVRRIETQEKRLNERLVGARRRFYEHATKLIETRDAVATQQGRVQRAAVEAACLQASASATAQVLIAQNARLTDTTRLAELKRQLRSLEGENQQLAVQEEVLRYYVAQKQRVAATTQARTKPRTPGDTTS